MCIRDRIKERLDFAGICVVFVSQGFDSNAPQSQTLLTVHGLVDGLYLDRLREKTFRGVEQLALQGLHTGGRVFGYRRVPIESATKHDSFGRPVIEGVRLAIDPNQALTIQKIFERYVAGHSFKRIAIDLNDEGVLSPQPQRGRVARSWCPSSIHHILHNERYRGVVIWGKTQKIRTPEGKRIYRRTKKSNWHKKEIPAQRIVSDGLWNAAQQRMQVIRHLYGVGEMSSRRRGRGASSPHIFTGLLKCKCGGSITVVSGNWKKRRVRYGCSMHAYRGNSQCKNGLLQDAAEVEGAILRGLQRMVLHPDVVEYTLGRFEQGLRRVIKRRGELQDQFTVKKSEIEAAIKNCADAIAGGQAVKPLTQKIVELEKELADCEGQARESAPSFDVQIRNSRRFVLTRLRDLRSVFHQDPRTIREEIARHMSKGFTLTVENGKYVANGFWDWLGGGGYYGAGGQNRTGYARLFRAALYH